MLNKLPEEYVQEEFDPVLFELQQLPPTVDEQALDNIVDARATVLEVSLCCSATPHQLATNCLSQACMARSNLEHNYTLQVVGEKLSRHVLANYEEFVRGVNEVASIEKDLQVSCVALWKVVTAIYAMC